MTLRQIKNANIKLECLTTARLYIFSDSDVELYEQVGEGEELNWNNIPSKLMSCEVISITNSYDDLCVIVKCDDKYIHDIDYPTGW